MYPEKNSLSCENGFENARVLRETHVYRLTSLVLCYTVSIAKLLYSGRKTRMKQETPLELTPKNLYRLMTGKLTLFGACLSVSDEQVKGMTLVSFWRALLKDVLSVEILTTLFPDNGTHPRVQSSLMNRTGARPTPRFIRIDLDTRLSPRVLLTLISNCSEMLTLWNYDSARFQSALNLFEDQCAKGDSFLNNSIYRYLLLLRADYDLRFDGRHSPVLFRDSLRFAWNALFALFGPDMNGEELRRLRMDNNASPVALWEILCMDQTLNNKIHSTVRIYGQLAGFPLPEDDYIPLSLTPREALRLVQGKKKVLLSGIGGSGKTQLACQVYSLARGQSAYDMIVMLTAGGSLIEDFAALFPDKVNSRGDDPLEEIWKMLNTPATLLIVDGLDSPSGEEQVLNALQGLSCDLLITSRAASLDGFVAVAIPQMSEEEAVLLLMLAGKGYFTEKDREALKSLSNRLEGHPLTLLLTGSLCQSHYLTLAEILEHLSANGFEGLSLGAGEEKQDLCTLLSTLFIRVPLQKEERQLMRLLSMLPERTWRPSELNPYTADFEKTGISLAETLERLSTLGLLRRELTGYHLHPVIAETFRIPAIRADEFPYLWAALRKDYSEEINPEIQERYPVTLRMIQTTAGPNRDALYVLDRLCSTVMARPRWQALPWMLEKYQDWLDKLPHSSADEINCIACRMLWCTVLPWREQLDGLAEDLARYSGQDMLAADHYILLVNMMEIGGNFIRRDLLLTLLERLRPPEEPVLRLINYLNFYGGTQRTVLQDPEAALKTLHEARELIDRNGMLDTVEDATNDTRTAYALADMKRFEETLPLMSRVLTILKKRGYDDDSPTIRASRNSLNYFRGRCGDMVAARDSLKESIEQREKIGPPYDNDYIAVLTNYGAILLVLYQMEEAETVARKAVKLCQDTPGVCQSQLPIALGLLAHILQLEDRSAEALGYYMKADALFREVMPENNPIYLNNRVLMAEAMIAVGQTEDGNRILSDIQLIRERKKKK